jgi:hypothetical protein
MPRYTPEQMAAAKKRLDADYLEEESAPPTREENEGKMRELDTLLTAFETTHPIAELYAVTELDGKDVIEHPEKYPVRVAAKRDLIPIVAALNSISPTTEGYDKLRARYTYLSRAVGIINGGKVDHTR